MRISLFERSAAVVLCVLGLVSPSVAQQVSVSVAGQAVQANAQMTEGVVIGEVLPVLAALEVEASYIEADNVLSGRAPDGTRFRVVIGSKQLEIEGQTVECRAAFRMAEDNVIGPIAELTRELGCSVHYDAKAHELRIAHRLTRVEAHVADTGALVYIRLSGAAHGELHRLTDPPRAYVDFAGFAWDGGTEVLEIGGTGGLKRIRWALFQLWPPITRVVVDLKPGAEATVAQIADRMFVLTVRPGGFPPIAPRDKSLANKHIVVDPAPTAEGPASQGANAAANTITLDVAVRLAVRLMNAGAMVTLTRDSEAPVALQERARLAREMKADLLVTIRCAISAKSGECGVETGYGDDRSAKVASALQRALAAQDGTKDRGTVASPRASLPGVDMTSAECVVGFLSCPDDEKRLASANQREQIAAALAEGIAAYFAQ